MAEQLQVRSVLVLLGAAGLLLAIVVPSEAVQVYFPDANLEEAIRDELDIPDDPITDTDMEGLGWLYAESENIANLQGMEYAVNLSNLYLTGNEISDLSPLSGLTSLSDLVLSYNQITNLSALSGLTHLKSLALDANEAISDISALSGLTNLTSLDLSYNQISNLIPLSGLTSLTSVRLGGNQITNISALSGLTNLKSLVLYDNQQMPSDISALSGLTNLTFLDLSNNPQISDISSLSGLTNLSGLGLSGNSISDISPLSGLTHLSSLALGSNQISDTSTIAGLTGLTEFFLGFNQIEIMNLYGAGLLHLRAFDISYNPLTHILLSQVSLNQSALDALMDGGATYRTGLAELEGVSTLEMSGVDFSGISNLSKMYTMDDLETLLLAHASNLDGSRVVTLIGELPSLDWLDVRGLWETFDASTRVSLSAWDAVEGNTLITVDSPVPGDLNHDGTVNELDAQIMAKQWGMDGTGYTYSADINTDGAVDAADAAILAANWGSSTNETTAVPEPSVVGLLVTGLLTSVLGFRRRRSQP